MKGNASRGVILAGIAVLIGGLILWSGFDSGTSSSAESVTVGGTTAPTATPTVAAPEDDGVVPDPPVDTTADDQVFTLRPPAEVRVLVANGAGINGAAGRGKDTLVANGYNALPPADALGVSLVSTIFYWNEGYEGDAREIARILGGTPDQLQTWPAEVPVVDSAGANVLVVLGTDLATSG